MTKIIADFCSNHLNDRRIIEEGIKQLASIGVDYVKFQLFMAKNLNKNFPDYENAYKYYESLELSDETVGFIFDKCEIYGIKPLFTVFDMECAKRLLQFTYEIVKIASPDADNIELRCYCYREFETVIVSTGMISDFNTFRRCSGDRVLYCISKYPTKYEDIDFERMKMFNGFSDHTQDLIASKKAIEMGMEYVERHFTLGKYLPGKDHFLSSTPDEFKELCDLRNYLEKVEIYKKRWRNE